MALVLKDRVKEQTTTTGTGTITLDGTVSGFESFASVGDGNTTYYAIVSQSADEWEVGLGTYTAAGTLLSRDTILESSNSDAAVNFSAGTKDVFVTYPSDKAVYADAAGEVSVTRATSATFAASATNATTAVSATNATSATFATSATRATSATFATSATEAATAIFATSATNATTAVSATNATSATFATSATNATNQNGGTVSATSGTFNTLIANGLTYPSTDGTASQIIETNGSGTLSFVSVSGGATDIDGLSDGFTSGTSALYLGTDVGNSNTATNTAVGQQSLQSITGASGGVVAFGWKAGKSNTSGYWNTFIGATAADGVTTGNKNVLIGYDVSKTLTTGINNVIIGSQAAEDLSTGSSNTIIGEDAGRATATNANCIIMGQGAASSSNSVANEITLGNTSVTSFRIPGVDFYSLNGDVGIGTSSPRAPLHVQPAGGASDDFNVLVSQFRPNIVLEDLSGSATDFQFFVDANAFQIRSGDASTDTKLASELVHITSAGLVGIGTASPSTLLHLASTGSAILTLEADTDNVTESDNARIELSQDGGAVTGHMGYATSANGISIWNNYGDYVRFGANNLERMRITGTGLVGIGTTAPLNRLHVVDATSALRFRQNGTIAEILLAGPSGGDAALYFGDAVDIARGGFYYDTSENQLQFRGYNNNTRMVISSAGNVGIGTTAPSQKLTVQGTDARIYLAGANTDINMTGTADGQLSLDGNGFGFGIALNSSGANLYTNSPIRALILGTDETERMRITGTGNVGIGTTTPTAELDIESTSPEIHLNDSDGVVGGAITSKVVFQANGSTHGNVGFGTGSGIMAVTNNQGNLYLQADVSNAQASSFINFTIDNSTKMRIISTGNVGIGTTAPSYKLHVVGDIYSSGDVISASDIRYKENLKIIPDAVDKINKLNGYTFTRTDTDNKNKRYAGVIAQEVQEVLPEVVSTNNEGYLTVSYGNMVSLLIEGIKEQHKEIEELKATVQQLINNS